MKNTYRIPTSALETVKTSITKLARKAERYGNHLTMTVSDPYATARNWYEVDYINHCQRKLETEMVEVVDVEIDCDIIRKGAYKVLARIDHSAQGNVVRALTETYYPEWATIPAKCQHCGGNHNQVYTFMVQSESGEILQVGRTCLKDYCGINPLSIGLANEIHDIFLDDEDRPLYTSTQTTVYSTLNALAQSIRIIREHGYVKSGEVGSNKQWLNRLADDIASDADRAEAEKLAELIRDHHEGDNLLTNIYTLLRCEYCKARDFGYIAYAPLAIENTMREIARKAKLEEAKANEARQSEYIGEVGERLTVEVDSMVLLASWETQYGMTHLYKITDKAGNVLVWYASSVQDEDNMKRIKATVKDHNERDGVKQTVVTRCKAC